MDAAEQYPPHERRRALFKVFKFPDSCTRGGHPATRFPEDKSDEGPGDAGSPRSGRGPVAHGTSHGLGATPNRSPSLAGAMSGSVFQQKLRLSRITSGSRIDQKVPIPHIRGGGIGPARHTSPLRLSSVCGQKLSLNWITFGQRITWLTRAGKVALTLRSASVGPSSAGPAERCSALLPTWAGTPELMPTSRSVLLPGPRVSQVSHSPILDKPGSR